MKTGVVVDASLWVASLLPQDAFNPASQRWLQLQHSQGVELIAPVFLLTEVAGVISRHTGNPLLARQAVETMMRLPGLTLVRMNDTLVKQATELAADLGLRGGDALYVAAAAQLNLPLATYDQDQKRRAATILPEIVTPA